MLDLFRTPIIGGLARWHHARPVAQGVLFVVAAAVVVHGLAGPQIAPRNMATVFTWVHYRGLVVLAILAIGNLFCAGCPMILVRDGARRFAHPGWRWPRRLRGKWLSLLLFAVVLFVYELYDLWALPAATAWLVLGYFAGALLVDVLFAGASFCKYVCPVGQFNFAASLMSPAELQVREMGTCRSCRTADCIKGRPAARPEPSPAVAKIAVATPRAVKQRGCELGLFLPMKTGNMDCTLCLDCVRACPHDNIGLFTRVPGAELLETGRRRSGIGRLSQRRDLGALAVLFTFAALLNAFAMTAPAVSLEARLARSLSTGSEAIALGSLFVGALVLLPIALLTAAAAATRLLAGSQRIPMRATALRYAYALVPLGLGIWLAHYGFHFLTGALAVVPVVQSAAIDLAGAPVLGEPLWRWAGMSPGSVFPIQLGFMLLGAAGSVGLASAMSQRDYPGRAVLTSAPWVVLTGVLTLAAMWILAQPMDMRGVGGIG